MKDGCSSFGGGDFDYNDLVFSLTNVVFAEAPGSGGVSDGGPGGGELAVEAEEPGTLVLFGAGLSVLVVAMKRRAASGRLQAARSISSLCSRTSARYH